MKLILKILPLPQWAHPYGYGKRESITNTPLKMNSKFQTFWQSSVKLCNFLPFHQYANVNGLAIATAVRTVSHIRRSCVLAYASANAWLRLASIRTLCRTYYIAWPIVNRGCDAFACDDLNCSMLHIVCHIVSIYNDLCDALQCEWFRHHRCFSSIVRHLSWLHQKLSCQILGRILT